MKQLDVSIEINGAQKSAEWVTKSHLSLTGASRKIGLYYDKQQGSWYLPLGRAPSTHIVKQSYVWLQDIVINEQLCLLTAQQLGISVPESFVLKVPYTGNDELSFTPASFRQSSEGSGNALEYSDFRFSHWKYR